MNYHNIKIFVAIAENANISSAAKTLHYARSTVSEALKLLEDELGVQLIARERGSRQVALTPAGRAFLPLAKDWLEADRRVRNFTRAPDKRVLRLAASVSAHEYIVPHIVRRFMREAPNMELRLLAMKNKDIRNDAENRSYDVAIIFGSYHINSRVKSLPFFEEARCILCPADTVLPNRVLTPEDLNPAFEVCYSKTISSEIREWRKNNLPRNSKAWAKVPDWLAIHNYLTDPRCWALVPTGIAVQSIDRRPGQLTVRKIEPVPAPRLCRLLVSKSYVTAGDTVDEEMLQCFLRCCAEYVDEQPYLKRNLLL